MTLTGKKTIAVNVVLTGLATIAVLARLLVRRRQHVSLKADDVFIVLVLVIAYALCILGVWAAATGFFGQQLQQMSKAKYGEYNKITFIDVILTQTCFGLIKMSVLLFYKRMFVTKRFKLVANVFIGLSAGFILVMVFGQVFSTKPVDRWWNYPANYDPFHQHKLTFNYTVWMVVMQAINMTLDITILALPLPVIKQLHMSTARKMSLVGCFATGFFCVIASAVRLYWTLQIHRVSTGQLSPLQLTAIFGWNNLWANVEVCSSIIAACLPTISPLFKATDGLVTKSRYVIVQSRLLLTSWKSSKASLSSASQSQSQDQVNATPSYRPFETTPMTESAMAQSGLLISKRDGLVTVIERSEVGRQNGIHVKKSFGVSYENKGQCG